MPRHPGRIIPRTAHSPLASVGKQCMCVGYSKIIDGETNENPASRRKAVKVGTSNPFITLERGYPDCYRHINHLIRNAPKADLKNRVPPNVEPNRSGRLYVYRYFTIDRPAGTTEASFITL